MTAAPPHVFFDYVCLWPDGLGPLSPAPSAALRIQTHAADRNVVTAAQEWLGADK